MRLILNNIEYETFSQHNDAEDFQRWLIIVSAMMTLTRSSKVAQKWKISWFVSWWLQCISWWISYDSDDCDNYDDVDSVKRAVGTRVPADMYSSSFLCWQILNILYTQILNILHSKILTNTKYQIQYRKSLILW